MGFKLNYLIPYRFHEIETKLSLQEIVQILKSQATYTNTFSLSSTKRGFRDYEGWIDKRSFKLRRISRIGYNSLIPISSGTITENKAGNRLLKIRVHVHPIVLKLLVFSTIFSLCIFLIYTFRDESSSREILTEQLIQKSIKPKYINQILTERNKSQEADNSYLLSLFTFVSAYLICLVYFNFEAKTTIKKLEHLLEKRTQTHLK